MLKLKLQYFGLLMWTTDSLEKTLMMGITEASSGSWWWTWKPGMLQSMGLQRVRHAWATELNWIEPLYLPCVYITYRIFWYVLVSFSTNSDICTRLFSFDLLTHLFVISFFLHIYMIGYFYLLSEIVNLPFPCAGYFCFK